MKRECKNCLAVVVVIVLATATVYAQATSRMIPFSGLQTTLEPGTTQALTVQMWDDATASTLITSEDQPSVSVDDAGRISFLFGSVLGGLNPDHFPSGASRFLDVIDPATGTSVLAGGRIALNATAFALSASTAITATNALQLGGVPADQYVTTTSADTNYLRNTTAQQTANFNISGNGTIGGSLIVNSSFPNGFALTNGTATLRGTIVGNSVLFGTTTNSPLSISANNGVNGGLVLDTNGRVGVGALFPASTLDVRGSLTLDPGVGNPVVLYTAASGGERNRYLELINAPTFPSASGLKAGGVLVADNYNFAQPAKNDLIVKGNVGIGTSTPNAKLFVNGEAANGVGIAATGNASQSLSKGGWVKAVMQIGANGAIVYCYNGLTGSSTGNCGFSVSHTLLGRYLINFGFQVHNRFAVVTPDYFDSQAGPVARTAAIQYFSQGNPSFIEVVIFGNTSVINEVGFTVVVY